MIKIRSSYIQPVDPDVELLSEFSHARIRTEMYLGPRDPRTQMVLEYNKATGPVLVETKWVPALFTYYREILDNALDELVARLKLPKGARLDITYDPQTLIFSIRDNGGGIPIAFDDRHGMHKATLALTKTKAGRNFGTRGDTRGMNGVGASVVNYCSTFFDLDIVRDGMNFVQNFNEGGVSNTDLIIGDPIIMPTDEKKTGTKISFQPSKQVFLDLSLPESFIAARVYEVALCYPGLKVSYNGKLIVVEKGGEKASLFPKHEPIELTIDVPDFNSRFWLVPNFLPDGGEHTHSLVNTIPMFQGGTHIDQFRKCFFSGLLSALERESKKRKLTPNRLDISEGLLIYNITQMTAPVFDGQAKTSLTNDSAATIIRKAMDDDPAFYKGIINKNETWINAIYARCADRTNKKDIEAAGKFAKKGRREKVEGLIDACGTNRSLCILALTEGLSALSGLNEVRDIETLGGIALQGKPMNIFDKTLDEIKNNKPITDIMKSIGLFPHQRVNRHALRYGKVYLLMDADEDGSSIIGLLVSMFYKLWPELFTDLNNPFIYVLDTPLIIASKGNQRKYWYKDQVDSFDADKYSKWEVTRAKGLAALETEDWENVLANPRLMPIVEDGNLAETLNMLFDETRADDRKTFMGI